MNRILGLAVPLVVFAATLPGAYVDVGGAMEEGFMLVFPERVLEGQLPHRDFLHLYGPGSLWMLAGVFAVFGVSLVAERTVGALQLVGVALAVRAWLQPWGEPAAAAAGVIAVVFAITPIGLVALPWMGALALLLWGVLLVTRAVEHDTPHLRAAVGGGVLVGLALLYRPDVVLAAGLAFVVLWRRLRPVRVPALAGVALGVSPMLVHVALAGPAAAIGGMVVDPVFRLRPGRTLPLPPSSGTLDGYLQRIAELDVLAWPAPTTIPVQLRSWLFAVTAATLLVVGAAVVATRRSRHGAGGVEGLRAQRLPVLAALAVGILPQALQRADSTHLAWVSCFTLAVAPVALAELIKAAGPARLAVGFGSVALLAALAFPAFTVRPYVELVLQASPAHRTGTKVEHRGRVFYVGRADIAAAVEAIAPQVDAATRAGDRLFVGPADLTRTPYVDSWLYHLFPELVPSTYFIEMDPGIANAEGSGLAADLASADVVLLTDTWDAWTEPNESDDPGDTAAADVLDSRFCLVAQQAGVSLFERCR